MPPKLSSKQSGDMKQKSLMSFFGKPAQNTTTPNAKAKPRLAPKSEAKPQLKGDSSSDVDVFQTPASKGPSQSSVTVASAKYSRSSDGGSIAETPPTSDPIDVDMLSAEEDAEGTGRSGKVKAVSTVFHHSRSRFLNVHFAEASYASKAQDCS